MGGGIKDVVPGPNPGVTGEFGLPGRHSFLEEEAEGLINATVFSGSILVEET